MAYNSTYLDADIYTYMHVGGKVLRTKYIGAIILISLLAVQIGFSSMASAAGNNNMSPSSGWLYGDGSVSFSICNQGSTSIKQAQVSFSATNYEIEVVHAFILQVNPQLGSNPGTFNNSTGIWTGLVEPSKCIELMGFGHPTGNIGDQMTVTMNLLSTTEVDNTIETYTGVSTTTPPLGTILPSDITSQARLLTTGSIVSGDTVSYQIDITNQGPGTLYGTNNFLLYGFVVPEGTTFSSVEDLDPSDHFEIDGSSCMQAGTVSMLQIPGMEDYNSRTLIFCFPTTPDGTLPAGETIYPFKVNLTAGASLASGDSDVVGLLESNDRGTADIVRSALSGVNVLTQNINNIAYLQYDPSDLQVTINRCPGQAATSTTGTGCFQVSFNKMIYAPSFSIDDIVLNGGTGSVTSFNQLDDYTWEVRVADVSPGTTLTLLLGTDSVQDYSAVLNNVQVLGENTIRFVNASTPSGNGSSNSDSTNSAQGTLANTGTNTNIAFLAFLLICVGVLLVYKTRSKNPSLKGPNTVEE